MISNIDEPSEEFAELRYQLLKVQAHLEVIEKELCEVGARIALKIERNRRLTPERYERLISSRKSLVVSALLRLVEKQDPYLHRVILRLPSFMEDLQ